MENLQKKMKEEKCLHELEVEKKMFRMKRLLTSEEEWDFIQLKPLAALKIKMTT